MSSPENDLTAEQTTRLVVIALTGFRNGLMTAFANVGMPPEVAREVSGAIARHAFDDPITRDRMAECALAEWHGTEHEHPENVQAIPLHIPCTHDHDGSDES